VKGIGTGIGVGMAGMGTAVVAIGAAVGKAGKELAGFTVQAAAYADDITTQAKVTGMSTTSLQAYKYAAELIDTSIRFFVYLFCSL